MFCNIQVIGCLMIVSVIATRLYIPFLFDEFRTWTYNIDTKNTQCLIIHTTGHIKFGICLWLFSTTMSDFSREFIWLFQNNRL